MDMSKAGAWLGAFVPRAGDGALALLSVFALAVILVVLGIVQGVAPSRPSAEEVFDPNSVTVSYPIVFSRDRLLNESRTEEEALKKELAAADQYVGAPTGSVSSSKSGKIEIDLGTATEHQTASQDPPPAPTAQQSPDLLPELQDREALRNRINQVLAANSIYDSTQLDELGLYRFQFSVSLFPQQDTAHDAVRVVATFAAPKLGSGGITDRDLATLYTNLLSRESTLAMNLLHEAGRAQEIDAPEKPGTHPTKDNAPSKHSKTAMPAEKAVDRSRSPNAANEDYLGGLGLFRKLYLSVGTGPLTPHDTCFGAAPFTIVPTSPSCVPLVLAIPSDPYMLSVLRYVFENADAEHAKQFRDLAFSVDDIADGIKALKHPETADKLFRLAPGTSGVCDLGPWSDILFDFGNKDYDEAVKRIQAENGFAKDTDIGQADPRPDFARAVHALNYGNAIFTILAQLSLSESGYPGEVAAIKRLKANATRYLTYAKILRRDLTDIEHAVGSKCTLDVEEHPSVPAAFRAKLTGSAQTLLGDPEILRLLPSFRSVFESNSTSVGTSYGGHLGPFGIAPVTATIGGGDERKLSSAELVTHASVVSYSGGSTDVDPDAAHPGFDNAGGWLLAPDQLDEGDPTRWIQRARNEWLAADVALPLWWPKATVLVTLSWVDQMTGKTYSHTSLRPFTVVLPGARRDATSLVKFLTRDLEIDGASDGPQISVPVNNAAFPVCPKGSYLFVIRGSNLWHSPRVFVGNEETSDVRIMPDLEGITTLFTAPEEITAKGSLADVEVATSNGFRSAGHVKLVKSESCSSAHAPT